MNLTAPQLHRRGVEAANSRQYAQARRDLALARTLTDDPDLAARIDGTSAYILDQTGEHASAERMLRELVQRPGLHTGTVALLRGQMGTLLMHAGRLDAAEDELSASINLLADEGTEVANLLMNRSMVLMQRHELGRCSDDLHRAIAVFSAAGADDAVARAQHNLGYAALLSGDLVTALSLMTRSRPALAASGAMAVAIGDLDRAEVLRDAGLTTEAEELLADVAAQFGAQRMRQAQGEAEYHRARSLLRHDPTAAQRTARIAARRFRALGGEAWAARADAVRLDARMRSGIAADRDEIEGTTAALRRAGFRTEATALTLTSRRDGRGRMPSLPADAPAPLRLRAHEVRAQRALAAGRHQAALRAAGDGLDLLTESQRSFGALDLQASVAMQGADLVFAGLEAAIRQGDPATVFAWSERARHLSQQVSPVRPPHDPGHAADLAEVRMLRADLAGADWTRDPRVQALRDRVRERQWSATGSRGSRRRLRLDEVQSRVGAGTVILSYVFTGTALHAVAVTESSATTIPLDLSDVIVAMDGLRADLDVAALTRGGPLAALVERSLGDRMRRLDDALLAPFRPLIDGTRVAITVPGLLSGLPWGMLPSLIGTPFTLATSVSRWLGDTAQATRVGQPTVGFATGPRVPRAEAEVDAAAQAWRSATTLTGTEATVARTAALAEGVDVLHIAAHGRHAGDNPMFSGLELADGTLFGYDVDLVPRAPATVVLSACELGRSAVRWGEEALGMTRVWLHAGTRCVIAAPVMVPDVVAAELLSAVHIGLARGETPAVALASATEATGHVSAFQCHGAGF